MKFGKWIEVTTLVLAAFWVVRTKAAGEVNPHSILCDDIEAICNSQGVSQLSPTVKDCTDGVLLSNMTTCNCGFFCMNPIEEGEKCYVRVSDAMPRESCGWGLECMNVEGLTHSICDKNLNKPCINASRNYETTGSLNPGQVRPNCDGEGKYAGKQCSPGSTCYCVDEDGNRIFGEALEVDSGNMNCACSRYWDDMEMEHISLGMRCLPNGNFDALQCIDDACFCFDDASQSLTFGPMPINVVIYMDCYNKSIHTPIYWQPCEKAYNHYMENETLDFTTGAREPQCSVDGFYHQVQYGDTHAFCADKYGNQIENFTVPLYQSDNMDCNCAHRWKLLEDRNLSTKPHCCPNGNYFPWQTKGLLAYCVDNNGNQYGQAVAITNVEALTCYSKNACP